MTEMNKQSMNTKTENRPAYREFDEVFEHVRSFGTLQRLLYFFTNLLMFPLEAQFSALIFVLGTVPFQCTTPNVTCAISKCCDNCTSYEFSGPFTTTITEWNLICDRAYLGATLQSCYFVGMLLGSFINGMISDAFGRKKCMLFSCLVMLVGGLPSVFVDCISFFGFLRFVVGFGLTGAMLSQYIYNIELVGPTKRTLAGNLCYFFWNGFGLLPILISYYVREWRMVLLIITLPIALILPFWKLVPESPRWLVAHGRLDEAHAVLMRFGGKKGKAIDADALRALIQEVREDQIVREKEEAKKHTPVDLFRTKKLRKWALIVCYSWFAVAFANYAIYLMVSHLAGDLYFNVFLMKLLITLRVPLTWFLLYKIGRRITHGMTFIIAGIACILALAVYKDYPMATTGLALVGFLFLSSNWTSVYLITSELFPTVLRNTAQGTGSTVARVGGIIAPYISMLAQLPGLSIAVPVAISGVVALVAGVSAYWIPETLHANLHQTIEESEAAKDDYGIPCMRKKTRETADLEAQHTGEPLLEMERDSDEQKQNEQKQNE